MIVATQAAEDEVKSRVRLLQRRGEIAGSTWYDLSNDLRSWLKRKARTYAEGGEAPHDAARHAVRRADREGRLPKP
jgi:hypothetical protein